jgi:hypothetical protein
VPALGTPPGTVLAQGGDPLEPPLACGPSDSVAAALALLAQGGDPLEAPVAGALRQPGIRRGRLER